MKALRHARKCLSPHIILPHKARDDMPGIRHDGAPITVDAVSLMRSDSGKSGMLYTEPGRITAEKSRREGTK